MIRRREAKVVGFGCVRHETIDGCVGCSFDHSEHVGELGGNASASSEKTLSDHIQSVPVQMELQALTIEEESSATQSSQRNSRGKTRG